MARVESVTVVSADIGHPTSGQSRFAINIAVGLRRLGRSVSVVGAEVVREAAQRLESEGIRVFSLGRRTTHPVYQAKLLTTSSNVGRQLAELANARAPADWFVALSESAVSIASYLPDSSTAYICQGDLSLLFLNPRFYLTGRWVKRILSRRSARFVLQNADYSSKFDVLLANSEFTRGFMSYLYRLPFAGVVYPPVDTDLFHPMVDEVTTDRYVVAVARNQAEDGLTSLARIAKSVPLRVVGGAIVPGAQNLGVVSDQRLSQLLSQATVTVAPVVAEFFGYPIAESLACGTPVVAFDAGGPSELITQGRTGSLVRSYRELESEVEKYFGSEPAPDVRAAARLAGCQFSISTSAGTLLKELEAHAPV